MKIFCAGKSARAFMRLRTANVSMCVRCGNVPREFYELSEMPRTSTGKISKRQILDDFLASKGDVS